MSRRDKRGRTEAMRKARAELRPETLEQKARETLWSRYEQRRSMAALNAACGSNRAEDLNRACDDLDIPRAAARAVQRVTSEMTMVAAGWASDTEFAAVADCAPDFDYWLPGGILDMYGFGLAAHLNEDGMARAAAICDTYLRSLPTQAAAAATDVATSLAFFALMGWVTDVAMLRGDPLPISPPPITLAPLTSLALDEPPAVRAMAQAAHDVFLLMNESGLNAPVTPDSPFLRDEPYVGTEASIAAALDAEIHVGRSAPSNEKGSHS